MLFNWLAGKGVLTKAVVRGCHMVAWHQGFLEACFGAESPHQKLATPPPNIIPFICL